MAGLPLEVLFGVGDAIGNDRARRAVDIVGDDALGPAEMQAVMARRGGATSVRATGLPESGSGAA